jgi:hypothetical protein
MVYTNVKIVHSVFEGRVLRNIFGPTTGKVTEGGERLFNKELQDPYQMLFACFWRDSPQWARASSLRILDHTQRCTTVERTPLEERSARNRDRCLTAKTLTTDKRPCLRWYSIRTHNLSGRAAADPRLRPRGHWDRHQMILGW